MAKYRIKEFDEEAGWQGELTVHFHNGYHVDREGQPFAEDIESRVLVGGDEFDIAEVAEHVKQAIEAGDWDKWVEKVPARTSSKDSSKDSDK
jgi:hypothetical protein